jgi:hypothetical protein
VSALSEISSLVISTATVGITRAGFGIPLIVSHNASFPERVRFYSDISDVGTDFAVDSPEYLAADAILSQSPHPDQLCIGRAANKPTQQYTIGQSAIRNSDTTSYKINVIGQGVTPTTAVYNSDSTATAPEIHNGLITALNAVIGKNYTAAFAALPNFTAIPFTVANAGTGTLTATGHGLNTGDGPIQLTTTGVLPAGLAVLTNYYIIAIDANTIQLATSLANALASTIVVGAYTGSSGTNDVTHQAGTLSPALPFLVTGSAPGNWFSLEVVDATALSNKQSHADPGIATDLSAMLTENSDWYAFTTLYNSQALVVAAAAWVETQSLIYLADVPETAACKTAGGSGGTADTLDDLHTLSRERTAGSYHPSPAMMMSAAWLGRMLPIDPGDDNWKFKTLSGVTTTKLTDTDRINLRARAANFYQLVIDGITCDGTVASGDFIDNTRGDDWVNDDMNKAVFGVLKAVNKVPMTDAGAALVEAEIRGSIGRAIDKGIYAATPKPIVNVPKVASISATDRAQRLLPNINWSATRAGAVNRVKTTGVVSV